jgi:hypothetical protein
MEERKEIQAGSGEPAKADNAPGQAQAKSDIKSELPSVESPSISPATPEPVIEPVAQPQPASEPTTAVAEPSAEIAATVVPITRHFKFNARHKRHACWPPRWRFAAGAGAVVGAVASGGFAASARSDLARPDERGGCSNDRPAVEGDHGAEGQCRGGQQIRACQVGKIAEQPNRAASEITA